MYLCKCNGVADLSKTRPSPYVLTCLIWSFCVRGCRHNYSIELHNWAALDRSLGIGGMANPKSTQLSDMCYHVKFGSSTTNGVCINKKETAKLESAWAPPPCGRVIADPPPLEIHLSTRVILPNLVVLGHTVSALLRFA